MIGNDMRNPLRDVSLSRRRAIQAAGVGGAGVLALAAAGPVLASSSGALNPGAARLHDAMRKLWEDHITWTRLFIVSAIAGLADLSPTANRLLKNQTDIGNAIVPFYGAAAGAKLTALLRDHILIAGELVMAAKAGDAAKVKDASARWYANANDIAAFLNAANPKNWPLDEMRMMMKEHLDLTLAEALARLHQDWAADVAAYDQIHTQILGMADMLSSGIAAQFPGKLNS